jgi:hypothetical protein
MSIPIDQVLLYSSDLQYSTHNHNQLRYVDGVIQMIFQVLQLLPIRLTQQNVCGIRKSMMNSSKTRIKIGTSPHLVMMIIGRACTMLILILNT